MKEDSVLAGIFVLRLPVVVFILLSLTVRMQWVRDNKIKTTVILKTNIHELIY